MPSPLAPTDLFAHRHIGPSDAEGVEMAKACGYDSVDALVDAVVPQGIRLPKALDLGAPRGENELLEELRGIAKQNEIFTSMIGMGYSGTITPPVILRNLLENPQWYTAYTPYQAEIAQGRLEALVNYQQMIVDLTAMPVSNAALLDEGTAASEAMNMCVHAGSGRRTFFIDEHCHPQTIAVVRTRAKGLNVAIRLGDAGSADLSECCGVLVQYPDTFGEIRDYAALTDKAHAAGAQVVAACDILALTLLTPPGEWGATGADIAIGSTQRFGVPMGFGGPHAAYMACKQDHLRRMPGRLIGLSKDAQGNPAYRMALSTREQHIRREKATSNICTSQVLLAITAAMYATYHGPEGLKAIAMRVHACADAVACGAKALGATVVTHKWFDTVTLDVADSAKVVAACEKRRINVRQVSATRIALAVDETTSVQNITDVLAALAEAKGKPVPAESADSLAVKGATRIANRKSGFLSHAVFNTHHSESEMMRYLFRLCAKDISLVHSMISLGSCTMKLNAASEMIPVTWPEFANMHPFAPAAQTKGYTRLITSLEKQLATITGFDAVSMQPNSGAQGEYAGLMTIRGWHESRGDKHRDICLIPTSAHGTNPASAAVAGMRVVTVKCLENGDVDVADLKVQAAAHAANLCCLMITYPSTHGVFEETVREICKITHAHGGRVYMDGANMNAQVGLTSPGEIGADVCHLNLHKTFCIPHGGGGPGMGPIGVVADLAPFLPGHPVVKCGGDVLGGHAFGSVSAAPFGSAMILPISWMYINLMGAEGVTRATKYAILNANYMAAKLKAHYPILYTGKTGLCAHEFILDTRVVKVVTVDDFAKRLMDFGFHGPTMSFPVPSTLMIEPTESESKDELDRFIEAMIKIKEEIGHIESGRWSATDNPLKNAPHTVRVIAKEEWPHPYTREEAAFPLPWLRAGKIWPTVGRIDNPYGDRNLACNCPPVEAFADLR